MGRTVVLACTAPHCRIRNRHQPACEGHDGECGNDRCQGCCDGCLPRTAQFGLQLCDICTRRIAEDAIRAGDLYDALGKVLIRKTRGGEHASGSTDRSPIPDAEVIEARSAIKSTLVDLARLIIRQRGFKAPDDTVREIAAIVAKSAPWLAAHPDAAQHARDLRDIASDSRHYRLAFPVPSDRLYIGDCPLTLVDLSSQTSVCGTRLYQSADEALIHCDGCDTDETIEWWQRQIAGEHNGWTDAYAIAAHLAMRWKRPVDPGLIRKWGQRTTNTGLAPKHRLEGPEDNPVRIVERDEKGRALYDLHAALAYAHRTWGMPA